MLSYLGVKQLIFNSCHLVWIFQDNKSEYVRISCEKHVKQINQEVRIEPKSKLMMKNVKYASTVIIAAKHNLKAAAATTQCDYRILTARRNVESSFMPNSHVFPGGGLESGDSSKDWELLHRKLNFSRLPLHGNLAKIFSDKLDIFKTPQNEYLPRYLSLRIAAIREAFEECGILLCRRSDTDRTEHGSVLDAGDTSALQDRDRSFLEVCETLRCFPDVWSLHEGRNWLTPAHLPKRFDTAFFFVALDTIPATNMDPREVSEIKWTAPKELLKMHEEQALWLPPPQLYELRNISRYDELRGLVSAAIQHRFCSPHCFLPVVVSLADGIAFVLPGDSCYEAATADSGQFQEETLESFRGLAKQLLRTEMAHDTRKTIFVETASDQIITKDLLSKI